MNHLTFFYIAAILASVGFGAGVAKLTAPSEKELIDRYLEEVSKNPEI